MQVKVGDLVSEGLWNWPQSWNDRFEVVMDIQVPKLIVQLDNKVVWINKKRKGEELFCQRSLEGHEDQLS